MDASTWFVASLLTFCLLTVGFAYAGYPVVIYFLSKLFGRSEEPPEQVGVVGGVDLRRGSGGVGPSLRSHPRFSTEGDDL